MAKKTTSKDKRGSGLPKEASKPLGPVSSYMTATFLASVGGFIALATPHIVDDIWTGPAFLPIFGVFFATFVISTLMLKPLADRIYPPWKTEKPLDSEAFVYVLFALFSLILPLSLLGCVIATRFLDDYREYTSEVATFSVFASLPSIVAFFYFYWVSRKRRELSFRNDKKDGELDLKASDPLRGDNQPLSGERMDREEAGRRVFLGSASNAPIFVSNATHILSYGETGCGKTTGVVIPNVLNWSGNLIVIDPKSEVAPLTYEHRRRLGHDVVFIAPENKHNFVSTPYNPLAPIVELINNHQLGKAQNIASSISNCLCPDVKNGSLPDWLTIGARRLLVTVMLYLGQYEPDLCCLPRLRFIVNDREKLEGVLFWVSNSDNLGADISSTAKNLLSEKEECESSSSTSYTNICDHATDSLQFASSNHEDIADGLSSKGAFRLRELYEEGKKPFTLYVCPPGIGSEGAGSELTTAWRRILAYSLFDELSAYARSDSPTLVIFDEFANIGYIPRVSDMLPTIRNKKACIWAIVQEPQQFSKAFGDEGPAINELFTVEQILQARKEFAEKISKRLGEESYYARTSGIGSGGGGHAGFDTRKQPVLRASEIEDLHHRKPKQAIIFTADYKGSAKPMLADMRPYWEFDPWQSEAAAYNPEERKNTPPLPKKHIKPYKAPLSELIAKRISGKKDTNDLARVGFEERLPRSKTLNTLHMLGDEPSTLDEAKL